MCTCVISDMDTLQESKPYVLATLHLMREVYFDIPSPLLSLSRIFSFLDVVSLCRTAQVSRLWHDLALHGSNWQSVDLFEFQMAIEV